MVFCLLLFIVLHLGFPISFLMCACVLSYGRHRVHVFFNMLTKEAVLRVTITCLLKHCVNNQNVGLQNGGTVYTAGLQ